jgi:RNA polymerase sigma-70 factor (ECF subfamily)
VYFATVSDPVQHAPPTAGKATPEMSVVRDARDEDARLVAAIREGNRGAEEQLYRRHAPGIQRLATRLLRSTDEARDVLQDTFLAALQDLDKLAEPRALRSWLQAICVRRVHRRFRRRKLLSVLGLDRSAEDAKLEQQASTDLDPEARADLRLIDTLLDRLPPAEKIAWVLRHVEELELAEAAEACGCSLATIKRRIAAADALVSRLRAGVIQ